MYTKKYLRKFEKLNGTIREQVELCKGKKLSNTDESIDNTDEVEAQISLTTGVLCATSTEELEFWSTLDSEAGGSLEQSEFFIGNTSDRVEDRYADHQLSAGVEAKEELLRINEGDIRHSNVWMDERDSDDLWFQLGAAFDCVNQGHGPRKDG